MRSRTTSCLLLVTALSFGAGCASDGGSQKVKAPTPQEMEQRMTEMATPGPAHQVLNAKVGTWKVQLKSPGGPDGEAMTWSGTSEVKWIFDGRYLEDRMVGDVMGMSFQGLGHTGYDNMKKCYVTSWLDSFSTAILYGEGRYDAAAKSFRYDMQMPNVVHGKTMKARTLEVMLDNDHWHFEIWEVGADGKDALSLQADYTRVK